MNAKELIDKVKSLNNESEYVSYYDNNIICLERDVDLKLTHYYSCIAFSINESNTSITFYEKDGNNTVPGFNKDVKVFTDLDCEISNDDIFYIIERIFEGEAEPFCYKDLRFRWIQ